MSGSTGTKSAIAHQVQVGHLFCTRHVVPLANASEKLQKFASQTNKYQAENLMAE
jgi:hypothetical protein